MHLENVTILVENFYLDKEVLNAATQSYCMLLVIAESLGEYLSIAYVIGSSREFSDACWEGRVDAIVALVAPDWAL